eukprot:gnl/MRDRNA2_/MRDRNA2_250328_c0_seq1.p1 gnl/MRDRNA2_/MRDRNA2_250328_c0~~gnl/MRDRNA2_/MRDRNA2_250328_c0_seq1.p1  ORF type:complete len:104 (+),score=10.77 gnl/MRDRNA2_/MRDRNA2_250328_c0_seq1:109-420(+)
MQLGRTTLVKMSLLKAELYKLGGTIACHGASRQSTCSNSTFVRATTKTHQIFASELPKMAAYHHNDSLDHFAICDRTGISAATITREIKGSDTVEAMLRTFSA